MIRYKAQERLGYYEALRGSAEAEYVERIDVSNPLALDNDLCLPAPQHPGSLLGAGRSVMPWRPLTATRQVNRSAYRVWHRRERGAGRLPYVAILCRNARR